MSMDVVIFIVGVPWPFEVICVKNVYTITTMHCSVSFQ